MHIMYSSDAKLLRFMGRPENLTPLARLKMFFLGYDKPFDRHDWIVIRNDDTQVRYVIDYYFDETKSEQDKVPQLHDAYSIQSISMVARPAIDTFESVVDRIKFPILGFLGQIKTKQALRADTTSLGKEDEGEKKRSMTNYAYHAEDHDVKERTDVKNPLNHVLSVPNVEATFKQLQAQCRHCFLDVKKCNDDMMMEEDNNTTTTLKCTQAATALQLCMAKLLCKPEAVHFSAAVASGDEAKVDAAYTAMSVCIENFEERARGAMALQARMAVHPGTNETT